MGYLGTEPCPSEWHRKWAPSWHGHNMRIFTKETVSQSVHIQILCSWVSFKNYNKGYLGTEPCPSERHQKWAPLWHGHNVRIFTKQTVSQSVHIQILCSWVGFKHYNKGNLETEPCPSEWHQKRALSWHGHNVKIFTKETVSQSVHIQILYSWVGFKHYNKGNLETEPCPLERHQKRAPSWHRHNVRIFTKQIVSQSVHIQILCSWVGFKHYNKGNLETEPYPLERHRKWALWWHRHNVRTFTKQTVSQSVHTQILCSWVDFKDYNKGYLETEPYPSEQHRKWAPLCHRCNVRIFTKQTV